MPVGLVRRHLSASLPRSAQFRTMSIGADGRRCAHCCSSDEIFARLSARRPGSCTRVHTAVAFGQILSVTTFMWTASRIRVSHRASTPATVPEGAVTDILDDEQSVDTHQKALRINLDPRWYGTVAEIGAGQEVARWFFRVGRRSGDHRQDDLRLRHGGQRRRLRRGRPLRLRGPAPGHAGPRVRPQHRPAERPAGRQHLLLRLRRHRRGPELPGRQRMPRLDGRQVPGPSAR